MSHTISLPALMGSHPLGALASFGLLRLATEWDPQAQLSFEMQDDWVARLHSEELSTAELLIEKLSAWVSSDVLDRLLEWAEDVRVPPKEYRKLLEQATGDDDHYFAAFLSAIACDGAVDGQKGLVKPSAFYMVSGQQTFLGGMQQVVAAVRASPEIGFKEALIGPWRYQTKAHSLGWDPNAERLYALRHRAPRGGRYPRRGSRHAERLYALRHRAPTAEKPSCIAGAVVLAFWALPLMPGVSVGGRPYTIGFTRRKEGTFLAWPIFSAPIDLAELTSLLRAGPRSWTNNDGSGFRSGIEAVFESLRYEFGQGYAVLRAARAVSATSLRE